MSHHGIRWGWIIVVIQKTKNWGALVSRCCEKLNVFSLRIVPYVLVVVLLCAHCCAASSDSSASGIPASAGQLYRAVEGRSVTVQLVILPERFQGEGTLPLELFEATPDSNFWWISRERPNPYDFLKMSVVFRERADFQVHFGPAEGDSLEVFDFGDVEPAAYRMNFDEANRPTAGRYMLRYRYKGQVVDEFVVQVVE